MSSSDEECAASTAETPGSSDEIRAASTLGPTDDDRSAIDDVTYDVSPAYRRTAGGLVAVGVVAAAGGVAFADARELLFAVAATGLFGGVLAVLLGSDRLVPVRVAEHVYDVTARNETAFVDALGLSERRIYVPTAVGAVLGGPAGDERPDMETLTAPWPSSEDPYLVLEPTGIGLYREVQRTVAPDLESGLEPAARALSEGLVAVLELVDDAVADVDAADEVATIRITGNSFGPVDRFDQPIASYLAVGYARVIDQPVTLEVHPDDGTADWLVICSWTSGT